MKKVENVLWGLVFILAGIIVGGNAIGIIDINLFFDGWWTLFIIIPACISLITEKGKIGSIIGIIIGVMLLLACQGIITFSVIGKLVLPLILVGVGISIMFRETVERKISDEIKNIENSKDLKEKEVYCATFSKQEVKSKEEKFEGANIIAVFGGVECDLRNAVIESDVVINATSVFGGADIYLPENVNIKIKSTAIFGGVENTRKDININEEYHTIYINAITVFGGIDIK